MADREVDLCEDVARRLRVLVGEAAVDLDPRRDGGEQVLIKALLAHIGVREVRKAKIRQHRGTANKTSRHLHLLRVCTFMRHDHGVVSRPVPDNV